MDHYDKFIEAKSQLLNGPVALSLKFEAMLTSIANYFDKVNTSPVDPLALFRSDFVVLKSSFVVPAQGSRTKCSHTKIVGRYIEDIDEENGQPTQTWVDETKFTYEDIDVGRFKCTQCGLVQYYTGQWKKFFEEGVPCSGSDLYFPGGPPQDAPVHKSKAALTESASVTYAISSEEIKKIIANSEIDISVDEVYSYLKLFLTYKPYIIPGYRSLISLNKFYLEKINEYYSFEERCVKGISQDSRVAAYAVQELRIEEYDYLIDKFEEELQSNKDIVGQDFSLTCVRVDLFSNTKYLLINVDYVNTSLEQAQVDSQADAVLIENIAKKYFPMIDGVFMLNYYIGEPSNILMGPIQTYTLPSKKIRG